MNKPSNMEGRFDRILQVLASAASGDFTQQIDVVEDDELTMIEHGVNILLEDIKNLLEEQRQHAKELERKQQEIIRLQEESLRELSTPVLEVWEDILVLPIVGVVDTKRSIDIMNNLLQNIVEKQSKCAIIDITGVEVVDTRTADYFLKVARASRLLGAHCVLTGLSPAVAQTLVEIGADLSEVKTLRNLKSGLSECLSLLRKEKEQATML